MDLLAQPFVLPCGAILPNRLCKSAMTEGMGDNYLHATDLHANLYRQWSEGGAGLLITGNVMIDRHVLERPGNVAIDITYPPSVSVDAKAALSQWAKAATSAGNHCWMQISHAGRQSPRYVTRHPVAPSEVQLDLLGNYAKPRALTETEILDFIQRFAKVAVIAKETGFTGVQIHAAHGYLISAFLSPITNQRTDKWGGSLENRARFLLETMRAVRHAVGPEFPVGIKLNSDDFRKGGFSNADCLAVVKLLNTETVDLLEISGGNYEQPRLLGVSGREQDAVAVRPSTRIREAYFLEYAEAIKAVASMPLMVTGGFRSRAGMEMALSSKVCDVIGIARPLCTHANAVKDLLQKKTDALPVFEDKLNLRPHGLFSPASPVLLFKMINVLGAQGWYYQQMVFLAQNEKLNLKRGILRSFIRYWWDDLTRAIQMKR
jgi:2,4-dienoyl-CoA reductase-like NADH-dependent reductase (Old Yellow Enzyme family)